MQNSSIVVRFTAEGFHFWAGAPESRVYLAYRHRHLFHIEVTLEVLHDDREIEFHDLLDFSKAAFGSGQFGGQSCEMLAAKLLDVLKAQYGAQRQASVSVFEDGEVGAVVDYVPETAPDADALTQYTKKFFERSAMPMPLEAGGDS